MSLTTVRRVVIACAAVIGAFAVAACGDDGGAQNPGTPIEVIDAVIPEPPLDIAAAYLVIRNHQAESDRVIGASSEVAGVVELHESRRDGQSMSMVQVDAIEIPANGEAALQVGGYHLMLFELNRPLQEGDRIPITLLMERAGAVEITAVVVASTGPGSGSALHPHQPRLLSRAVREEVAHGLVV